MTTSPLPELEALQRLLEPAARHGRVEVLVEVATAGRRLPVHAVTLGDDAPAAPTLVVVAGVHGLERIGTAVALAFLQSVLARLPWDELLQHALRRCRVAFVPLLNPAGMLLGRRSNGAGVDLMRNAPAIDGPSPTPLIGGHRWSAALPWYAGPAGAPMQPEASALVAFVARHTFGAPLAIAVDLHSGFGMRDRLWYPYARSDAPFPDLPAMRALEALLDATLPHHVYRVEPTAQVYRIRGDLWDHLHDLRRAAGPGVLLPLTLEMGSWTWVRKNPRQALTPLGRFNPVVSHRLERTVRRHLPLLDLLLRAVHAGPRWLPAPG